MHIVDIETAIVEHLHRVLPKTVLVQSFPPRPQDYVMQTANAAVLVRFVEERPKQEVFVSAGQTEVMFDINVVTRDFKSHTGVYPLYDAIKRALHRVQFTSGKAKGLVAVFRGGKYDNYDVQKGYWFYALRFSFDVPFSYYLVPDTEVVLTEIMFDDVESNNPDDPLIVS